MHEKTKSFIAALVTGVISTQSNAQELDIITRRVGTEDDSTQGIVRVYGADWCEPCNELERKLDESGLMKELESEGIIFEFISNQHENKDKSRPRVNEHIRRGGGLNNLNGVPDVFIYDTGRSSPNDRQELAIRGIRGFDGLEEYIRRYALDQDVSLLIGNESAHVLEALASDLFDLQYGRIDNTRVGFIIVPKEPKNPRTLQEMARLHCVGKSIQVIEPYITEQRESSRDKDENAGNYEKAQSIQNKREENLPRSLSAEVKTLNSYYDEGPLVIPEELRETTQAKAYQKSGREVIFQRRIPLDEQLSNISVDPQYDAFFRVELEKLRDERTTMQALYRELAGRDIKYVPENASHIPEGRMYIEGQLELAERDKLREAQVWVQLPVASLVYGSQTHGVARLLGDTSLIKINH